jgi:uncharacterized membrane protein
VISPQSSPEKNKKQEQQQQQPLEKENQVFSFLLLLFDHCFFLCFVLFLSFFLGGSIQHVMGHASVLLLPIPPGDEEKRRRTASEKNKNNTCPRMEHEAMKPVELTALYVMMVALVRK